MPKCNICPSIKSAKLALTKHRLRLLGQKKQPQPNLSSLVWPIYKSDYLVVEDMDGKFLGNSIWRNLDRFSVFDLCCF